MTNDLNQKKCMLYLVRHGESQWNTIKKRMGQFDSPLTNKGIKQAQQIADQLKDVTFTRIYTSDLGRAVETAHIIGKLLKVPVSLDPLLRERSFGIFEKKFKQEYKQVLRKKMPNPSELNWEQRLQFKLDPSVESDKEVTDRIIKFIHTVTLKQIGNNVLVITHSNITRHLMFRLKHIKYDGIPSGGIDHTGYIVLESDGKNISVKKMYKVTTKER